jgi:hypothetical protein
MTRLRVVGSSEPEPGEEDFGRLFAAEEKLKRQLAAVRQDIDKARRVYADREGLIMLPSVDRLRQQFGKRGR